jgi:hypothetical protein
MSDVRSGNSSDLALARELSRRLVIEARPLPTPEAARPPSYVAFPSRARGSSEIKRILEPPLVSVDQGSVCWDRLLDWCLHAFAGEAAFVMDDQGLVVATRGRMPPEAVQAVGSRLILALQHAERIADADGTSRSIAIELPDGWLNGLRATIGAEPAAIVLTVGIVTRGPLRTDERVAVERAFAGAAPRA